MENFSRSSGTKNVLTNWLSRSVVTNSPISSLNSPKSFEPEKLKLKSDSSLPDSQTKNNLFDTKIHINEFPNSSTSTNLRINDSFHLPTSNFKLENNSGSSNERNLNMYSDTS